MLLGLGVSSISDAGIAFAQNVKTLHDYYAIISQNKLPVLRGFFLSEEDLVFSKYILNVSCQGKILFQKEHLQELRKYSFPELKKLKQDGLLTWDEMGMEVTELGRHFIRNICKSFDLHLLRSHTDINKPAYSKAI